MKSTAFVLLPLCSLLLALGCVKQDDSNKPQVEIVAPANKLVLEKDSVLRIGVIANAPEGEITELELFIDDTIVKTFTAKPYYYDWQGAKLENHGVHTIKAVARDSSGATGQDKITVEIKDYRATFLGNFKFKVIRKFWMIGQPTAIDTFYYDGVIRRYVLADSQNDLYNEDDDTKENKDEKITIEFTEYNHITSLLKKDGRLVSKSGIHYNHQGGFTGLDKISFTLTGLGGLGAGSDYTVSGTRQ